MVYIYKTSHLLQHNSRKAPNTQFQVDKLRKTWGFKTQFVQKMDPPHKRPFFTRITIITSPENAQVAQTGDLEPVGQTKETT